MSNKNIVTIDQMYFLLINTNEVIRHTIAIFGSQKLQKERGSWMIDDIASE